MAHPAQTQEGLGLGAVLQECKFNKLTLNGRTKFHLKNLKLNDPVIEEVVMQVADALNEPVLCLAPLAAKLKHLRILGVNLAQKNKFFLL
jgi:hypothetical protein